MFAPYRSQASSYRQLDVETSVDGASPHRLIEMLFEAAIASIQRARAAMDAGDLSVKGESITRAIRIVDEGLKASLDARGGEISERLGALYDYVGRRLLSASARNDVSALDESSALLSELRDAWSGISPAPRRAETAALAR
jgi:flagellar protein FliS